MTTKSARTTDQLSQASQDTSTARSLNLEVIVEQPGAPCNLYQYDRERRALVLERVLQVEPTCPADLARYPLERLGAPIRNDHAAGAGEATAVW